MNQLDVFNRIGGIINELNEQYKYLESNPQKLNDLELELFVANAHFLADHAEILSKLQSRVITEKPQEIAQKVDTKAESIVEEIIKVAPVTRVTTTPEPVKAIEPPAKPVEPPVKPAEPRKSLIEKFFEPVVQQPKRDLKRGIELADTAKKDEPVPHIDLATEAQKDSYTFIMDEPEVIRHELVVDEDDDIGEDIEETAVEEEDEADEIIAADEPAPPVKEVAPVEKKDEPARDKDDVMTINQKISAQMGSANNITEQAGVQPVTNLKAAITLNDKLLYIKDLFNGYSLAYSEAIEILNRFNTFEEANRFLNKNYIAKNNWEAKPETMDKFFALLKRRYS